MLSSSWSSWFSVLEFCYWKLGAGTRNFHHDCVAVYFSHQLCSFSFLYSGTLSLNVCVSIIVISSHKYITTLILYDILLCLFWQILIYSVSVCHLFLKLCLCICVSVCAGMCTCVYTHRGQESAQKLQAVVSQSTWKLTLESATPGLMMSSNSVSPWSPCLTTVWLFL